MEQSDTFITIGKSFPELKRATRVITQERGVSKGGALIIQDILRRIDRLQVLEAAASSYQRSGEKLPKELRESLKEKYHISETEIQRLVYTNLVE